MPLPTRPRRSALFMPGDSVRTHRKARSLPVDVVILDLEDATSPAKKDIARQEVISTLREGGFGHREVVVRVNGLGTPWSDEDLEVLATVPLDAVLLPKVEDAAAVQEMNGRMDALGFPSQVAMWCMLETPLGVLHAERIAAGGGRLTTLVVGTSDLTKALRARHTRERTALLSSLSQCLLAGRAHGLTVLDGVHLDIQDPEGFLDTCRSGRTMGFDGRTLIHPSQIDVCNEQYAPSAKEIAEAARIVEAFQEGERAGRGVVVVDGRLIERLHADEAARTLTLAEQIESRNPTRAEAGTA